LQTTAPLVGQRLNAPLAVACLVLAIALPAMTLYGLVTAPAEVWLTGLGVKSSPSAGQPGWRITLWQSTLAVLVGMLPVLCVAYGLLRARLCFRGFVRGESFSVGTVRHLRGLAAGMLASAAAALLSPALVSVLLTWGAPAGQHAFSVRVGTNEVLMLLFAGIVWQITHVMAQAVELAEEHAQIV
jgi:hypothetical protein